MKRALGLAVAVVCLGLVSLSQAEVIQRGNVRVGFGGKISPTKLPRKGSAPVKVVVSAKIASTKAKQAPPQLRTIEIAINRYGVLDSTGLPVCEVDDIQPATTARALEECRESLVGEGRFSAKVLLPQQSPFPSNGKVYAFSGRYKGRPAILAHVYGTDPVPTSVTLPFTIVHSKGTYGTVLSTSFPRVTSAWGYVTGLSLTLGRRYSYRGKARSFVSASCPAPKGLPGAVFPFARASFGFKGKDLAPPPVTRSCTARR